MPILGSMQSMFTVSHQSEVVQMNHILHVSVFPGYEYLEIYKMQNYKEKEKLIKAYFF